MNVAESAIGVATLPADPAAGELKKSLKARHIEMIAIGGIIGAGLFVGSSSVIAAVGPAVVVSYAIAGLIVLLVMRMLSEMAVATPGVQSFPEFARLGLGDWAGFMSGWLYWYFWVVLVAIEAIAGAKIIHGWLPMFGVWEIGAALMAVLTGVNLLSARSYGEFEFWLSSIKVAAIIAFIVIAASYATGVTSPTGPTIGNLTAHGGFAPHGVLAIVGGTTGVIFALVGAEIATIAAAESPEPSRVIAKMTSSVALRILVFYILSVLLIVAVVPWNEIIPGESPFAAALARIGIPGAATIMTAIVLVAVLSCLNSGIYVTSRVLYGLARRGDAPAWTGALGNDHVPRRAILIGSAFGYVALATSILSPEQAFAFLVNASGAIMLVIYIFLAFAQLRLRARIEREAPARLTIRMWLHPWATIVAIVGMIGILLAMALTPDLTSQFLASLAAVGVVAIAHLATRSRRRAPN